MEKQRDEELPDIESATQEELETGERGAVKVE